MSTRDLTARQLTRDILSKHPDINAPIQDVTKRVRELRECGLDDEKVKHTVSRMFKLKDKADDLEGLEPREPDPDEILVFSLPDEYYREPSEWR